MFIANIPLVEPDWTRQIDTISVATEVVGTVQDLISRSLGTLCKEYAFSFSRVKVLGDFPLLW